MVEQFFSIQETVTDDNTVVCSLDTIEGSDCFGHWINECAIFLPAIKQLQLKYPTLKILLRHRRRFKLNILADFGFSEDDIIYSDTLSTDCHCSQWLYCNNLKYEWLYIDEARYCSHIRHGWAIPSNPSSVFIRPNYTFLNVTIIETTSFKSLVSQFKAWYGIPEDIPSKSIPFLYLIRSKKENYALNARAFQNIDQMVDMCKRQEIEILDIDTLSSLRDQIQKVLSAKTIILEWGSAMINATYFSKGSHVIILNSYVLGRHHIELMNHMMEQNGTDFTRFHPVPNLPNFTIDIDALERYIVTLKEPSKELHLP